MGKRSRSRHNVTATLMLLGMAVAALAMVGASWLLTYRAATASGIVVAQFLQPGSRHGAYLVQ